MKILVIHASAGAGHQKAAEAIYHGIKNHSTHSAVCLDALDLTSPSFKKMYRGSYVFFITKIPWAWGFFFAVLDLPWLQPIIRGIRRAYNSINAKALHSFLENEKFDYIFSTHFLATEVAAALKRRGSIKSKLVTVVTDFDVHHIWLADGVDCYSVASDWTKEKLGRLGIDANKIVVTGIPTDEKFSRQPDVGSLKRKLGLEQNVFTILMATGSFGIGPIEEMIAALEGFQIVVVCGNNKNLYERLSANKNSLVKVCGLVDNMDELMAVSDCMLTKPGGLSISEALVSHLPLVFFNAIPGQEANNVRVLEQHGIGTSGTGIKEIRNHLENLRNLHDGFLTAVRKTKELAKPSAVKDLVSLIK